MATIIRPATPDDGAFLGWASVMASRSQLKRGWFEIVLQRDDAFCFEFAKYLTLARAVSWWHWSLFLVAEVDGVVASMAYLEGEVIVKHVSNPAGMGIVLRGIDPRRAPQVLDLGRTLMEGKVQYLQHPDTIPADDPDFLGPDSFQTGRQPGLRDRPDKLQLRNVLGIEDDHERSFSASRVASTASTSSRISGSS